MIHTKDKTIKTILPDSYEIVEDEYTKIIKTNDTEKATTISGVIKEALQDSIFDIKKAKKEASHFFPNLHHNR